MLQLKWHKLKLMLLDNAGVHVLCNDMTNMCACVCAPVVYLSIVASLEVASTQLHNIPSAM